MMKKELRQSNISMEPEPKSSVYEISREDLLIKEIECVLNRNKTVTYLKAVLTRALILENIKK